MKFSSCIPFVLGEKRIVTDVLSVGIKVVFNADESGIEKALSSLNGSYPSKSIPTVPVLVKVTSSSFTYPLKTSPKSKGETENETCPGTTSAAIGIV